MSIFEDTNARELKELLTQIQRGETALPDFQRDFVWDPENTQDLIVSIASNYPAGSLLRIRNSRALFAARAFQGAPPLGSRRPTFLVLDGQQRLTSLYQAFYGAGEYRYYIDLQRLMAGDELGECLFHLRATHPRAVEYTSEEAQARDLVWPLALMQGGASAFGRWSRRIVRQASGARRDTLEDGLSDIQEKWIEPIDDYRFPVVTLSEKTSLDAICSIFEAVNRASVKLSVYDLLTARLRSDGLNLRQLWANAKLQYPIVADFDIDPYTMLQVVSLVGYDPPICQRKYVLNLDARDIRYWWDACVAGLAAALTLLRDRCGVLGPDWLPYPALLLTLAAALTQREGGEPSTRETERQLTRWFWRAVFGQTYETDPTGQAGRDVAALRSWLTGGPEPATLADFPFDPAILRDVTTRQRALYRGTLALLAARRPRDLNTGLPLFDTPADAPPLEARPVFSDSAASEGPTGGRRDSVLNRMLVARKSGRGRSKAPSVWLAEAEQALTQAELDAVLDSLLLPTGTDSPLARNDLGAFLDWRQAALGAEISRLVREGGAEEEREEREVGEAVDLVVESA